jgi:cytochrome P450
MNLSLHLCRYGSVFRTSILGYPMVISTDPDVNKFILHNDDRLFVPHYPSHFTQLLGKWNIFAARGDFHKRMRGTVLRFVNISVVKEKLLSEMQNIINTSWSGWRGRKVIKETEIWEPASQQLTV